MDALNGSGKVDILSIGGGAAPAVREMIARVRVGGHVLVLDRDEVPGADLNWLSVVTGKLKYTDGQGADMVHFTGEIDHTLNPGCEIPEDTNLWATGTYNPGQGIFNIGLFGPDDENYDEEKCVDCEACWRLWLVGGQFDGYQNWACTLVNEEALTYAEHPPDSACGSD